MQCLQGGGSAWWKEQSYVQHDQSNTPPRNKHQQQHNEYTAATQVTALKQPTLSGTFKRKEKLPHNSEKAKTAQIAEFIALDDQPLSVVENGGFKGQLECFSPFFSLNALHKDRIGKNRYRQWLLLPVL